MNKKILITGAAGFIGRQLTATLCNRKYDISLLVRPGTQIKKIFPNSEKHSIIEADLREIKKLRELIGQQEYAAIIHLGAIRNRQHTSAEDYFTANIQATEQLAIRAQELQAKFIYFSSVGVFGNIPESLPAGNGSRIISDNLYHDSKIQSERLINKYVLYGLKAAIIRPVITYGPGDNGFPINLIRLIDKKILILPRPAPQIHLGNVELLVQAVQKLLENDYRPGVSYNIGDSSPVNLLELADYISNELHGRKFNRNMTLPVSWFRNAERITALLSLQSWQHRFQLMSRNWYYNVDDAFHDLSLKHTETIPAIRSTIEWYRKTKSKKRT